MDELRVLLTQFEGRRIDFKEEVSNNLYKLLSAFANTAGGTVILGVRDGDHYILVPDQGGGAVDGSDVAR